MSDSERDLTALHGPALLNGTFSRDTSMRDVLEMVLQFKDVEFGLFRILSKDIRGYFGVAFGKTIVGAHTTSSREYGVPALRELLAGNKGMFIFAQLREFPIEVRQSLDIPLNEMLDWRPEGVPPSLVPSLPDAVKPWEQSQISLEMSECWSALRLGTMPGPMDAAEEEASFMGFWGGKGKQEDDDRTPAKPLSALLPKAAAGDSGATQAAKQQNPMAITVEIMPVGDGLSAAAADVTPAVSSQILPDGSVVQVKQEVAASWAPQPRAEAMPQSRVEVVPEQRAEVTPQPSVEVPPPQVPSNGPAEVTAESAFRAIPPPKIEVPFSVDDEQEVTQANPVYKEEVANSWIGQPRMDTPQSSPQQAMPMQPPARPPVQPVEARDQTESQDTGWSKTDLDAIGRVEMPVEAPKSGLAVSGRFKGAAGGEGLPDELRVSQRVHRPDPELSASGRFYAADIAAVAGIQASSTEGFDARAAMEAAPDKKPIDMIFVACCVVSFLLFGWGAFQVATYMMGSAPSEVNAAASQLGDGNFDVAQQKMEAYVKANPSNTAAKLLLCVAMIDKKDYANAVKLADGILSADATAYDALRLRATANAQLQKYKEAITDVDAYLKAAPDDDPASRAQALAVRAYADMKLGKLDDSIADYTKACKLDEKNMHLFASRGIVREMKKAQAK